jgi:hypothetical protein
MYTRVLAACSTRRGKPGASHLELNTPVAETKPTSNAITSDSNRSKYYLDLYVISIFHVLKAHVTVCTRLYSYLCWPLGWLAPSHYDLFRYPYLKSLAPSEPLPMLWSPSELRLLQVFSHTTIQLHYSTFSFKSEAAEAVRRSTGWVSNRGIGRAWSGRARACTWAWPGHAPCTLGPAFPRHPARPVRNRAAQSRV